MGTLDGIRVIDFGQYVAGPLAAVMLADQGADVIHVDPPGGPRWNHPADAFYNRHKRRITLDLKSESDLEIARRLVQSADVVIENFRPGVMDKLGLGAEATTTKSPALIYCSIPGFASDDPRAGVAAWEGVVSAATDTYVPVGEIVPAGDPRLTDPARPAYTPLPIASNFAGFHAAAAITMALIARERTGRGQRIEVPMFDTMFELIGGNGISVDGWYPMGRASQYPTFVCQDGRRVLFNSASGRFLTWFAREAGLDDWAAEGLLDLGRLEREPELRTKLRARLGELMLTRPAQEWEDLTNRAGGPTAMVRTVREWIDHPHARARNTVVQIDDPELGPTWMPGFQAHMTDSQGHVNVPRHLPDADRAEIIAELATLASLAVNPSQAELKSALEGVRVLDLTQVVAGPCAGRLLVEYGADVIKINNTRPESLTKAVSLSGKFTDPGNQQHEHLNRGKQTILLDMHTPEGLQLFYKLAEKTDVLMQNYAHGQAEKYGIDYEKIRAINPDIIYFSLSAYGYGGPLGGYRGFEPNAQAATGLMDRFGGDGAPITQAYLLDDYGTGVRGALAVALGIFHHLKTGRGQHINISLVETATYHQAPFLLDYAGKVADEPRGVDQLGSRPLHRLYQASDGWFFLGAAPDGQSALGGIPELSHAASLEGEALERALETAFASGTIERWVGKLRAVDIGAHGIERVETLMSDPSNRARGLSLVQAIEGVGNMEMPGVAARLSGTPLRVGYPVHPVGSDAPAILAELGMADQMERLIEQGAISLSVIAPSSEKALV